MNGKEKCKSMKEARARLAKEYGIPVRFVGLGEGIDDLQVFNAKEFVDNLL